MAWIKINQKGLSPLLTSLLIALSCIMLAVLIPSFFRFNKLKKQQEAQRNLYILYDLENKFFKKHERYSVSLKELRFQKTDSYQYQIFLPSENTFTITAVTNLDKDQALDIWTINENGVLISKSNDILKE